MAHRTPTKASTEIGRYSKAIVSTLGAILLLLSQITPVLQFAPASAQAAVGTLIVVLTGVSTFLVKNTPTVQTTIDDARNLGLDVKEAV